MAISRLFKKKDPPSSFTRENRKLDYCCVGANIARKKSWNQISRNNEQRLYCATVVEFNQVQKKSGVPKEVFCWRKINLQEEYIYFHVGDCKYKRVKILN